VLNGVVCSDGEGYSKKEAQQNASEKTLNMLRSDKNFVERILVVVSEQTDQEETDKDSEKSNVENTFAVSAVEQAVDDLSLDDVTARELSREDIIAAAEAAAYAEKK
jgi:ribonuclease-3